ncbi:MAG TPA: CinA family protein [Nitrospirae bacterium]|nr:CinA family protein [Nitrospirota bacterium]HEW81015.1 CinA family protein [Nitrospirota bacterium]
MLKSNSMRQETLDIVIKLQALFEDRWAFLSTAESCTGGLISHYITSVAGSSAYFSGGIVSYSEDMKKKVLGMSPDTIAKHGVVSKETAREMAERALEISGSDYSVSSTGNLGPDVLEEKEKGLVYIAASGNGKTISKELHLTGDREANKEDAVFEALRLLIEFVEEEGS